MYLENRVKGILEERKICYELQYSEDVSIFYAYINNKLFALTILDNKTIIGGICNYELRVTNSSAKTNDEILELLEKDIDKCIRGEIV